ncbi:MAG: NnrS family protein [Kiloniellaceae bacterium]
MRGLTRTVRGAADGAFLSEGLRPFFLGGSLYAIVALTAWMGALAGWWSLPIAMDTLAWHAHEMLFGFALASVAGFALTAMPNWTGRPKLRGWPLCILVVLWLSGRLAMNLSEPAGLWLAAALDLAFPLVVAVFAAHEVIAARFWRGMILVTLLSLFLAADGLVQWGILHDLPECIAAGERAGLSVLVLLISLVGGRVIPAFTGNWLEARKLPRPPTHGWVDRAALASTAGALLLWTVLPAQDATAGAAGLAALLQAARLSRWGGLRAWSEPLVWSLHLAYLWVPVGLALLAGSILFPGGVSAVAPVHGLAAGAILGMILAIQTRATLGHTGRRLHADGLVSAIYISAHLCAVLRLVAEVVPGYYTAFLSASALLWITAFSLFLVRFGPMLLGPRVDAKLGAPTAVRA